MLISYDEFSNLITKHLGSGENFVFDLLETIIDNPSRYCGIFRLSNTRTKIIQNVTQSREIKFGGIMEELTTEYIERLGYKNFSKDLGKNKDGNMLKVDQYFADTQTGELYIVEMKVRDDHDSTKKRGQYENFHKKIELVQSKNPGRHLTAIMWFVDDSLTKDKKYYSDCIKNDRTFFKNVRLELCYGDSFFKLLHNGQTAWNELVSILQQYHNDVDIEVPDFGNDKDVLDALLHLDSAHWNKLMSDKSEYILLRKSLFYSGDNLEKAKRIRGNH